MAIEVQIYIDLNGDLLEFREGTDENNNRVHEYKISGKVIPSTTQILQQQELAPAFDADNKTIVQAAQRGTNIHAEIEGKKALLSNEAIWVHKQVLPKYESKNFETLLHYQGIYAGKCDFYGRCKRTHTVDIIDWKSGQIHKETVRWQLTMYYHALLEMGLIEKWEKVRLFVGDLKEDHSELILIEQINEEEFKKLVQAVIEQKKYLKPLYSYEVSNYTNPLTKEEFDVFFALYDRIPETLKYALCKEYTSKASYFEKKLKEKTLADNKEICQATDGTKWTVYTQSRDSFMESKFKEEHAKLYKRYVKHSNLVCFRYDSCPLIPKVEKKPKEA